MKRRGFLKLFGLGAAAAATAPLAPAASAAPALAAAAPALPEPDYDPPGYNIAGIVCDDGELFAVSGDGEILTSPDGITWTSREPDRE
jgi:hypothetical protein